MTKYKKGKIIKGVVSGIESYGAFVTFDDFYTGLIHISEISHGYVKSITEYINIGDTIYTQIIDIDEETNHLKLSIKNINYKPKYRKRKKRINETPQGFKTLAYKLPKWIESNIEAIKKNKIYWKILTKINSDGIVITVWVITGD